MALLWIEGFEGMGASGAEVTPNTMFNQKYTSDAQATLNIATGRDGVNACLYWDAQGHVVMTPPLTNNVTTITGFAYKSGNLTTNHPICTFRHYSGAGSAISYISLELWQIGDELEVNRGNSSINVTTTNVLQADTWQYIEMKVLCADSGGTVEVKVDGTTVISEASVDTAYSTGATSYPVVGFRNLSNPSTSFYIDDWYVCDGSGSTHNDFLGDCKVFTLFPNGDASGNMTANSGSDEYAMVNSTTQNTSNYIKDTTSGDRCVFEYETLGYTPNTILGVQVTTEAALSGNLTKGIKTLSQNASGTVNTHTAFPILQDASAVTHIAPVNADGDAWTKALLDTARFGVEVV